MFITHRRAKHFRCRFFIRNDDGDELLDDIRLTQGSPPHLGQLPNTFFGYIAFLAENDPNLHTDRTL